MTYSNDVEGSSPSAKIIANPNKILPFLSQDLQNPVQKWTKTSLETLEAHCVAFTPVEGSFDKLVNPLVEGLRSFSPSNDIYCPKCSKYVRMTKNGKTNESYQFICTNGEKAHQVSALQIISTIPDELMINLADFLDRPYKNNLLVWAGREHLCPELWDLKGSKNATKRFAVELSPIKTSDTKVRAVNNSLEAELVLTRNTIQRLNERLMSSEEKNRNLESALKGAMEENALLRRLYAQNEGATDQKSEEVGEDAQTLKTALKASMEENDLLRKYLSQGKMAVEGSKSTFATVTNIHKPVQAKKNLTYKPSDVVSKGYIKANETESDETLDKKKFAFSPMKMIYFEGCQRRVPVVYRQMFREIGIDNKSVRDLTFLAEDILQIMTYESAIPAITEAMEKIAPSVRRILNFDPCKATSYAKYAAEITDEQAKSAYFAMMTKSAERITKMSENMKSLKRTAAFMTKMVEMKVTNYEPAIRTPRCFVLGDFIASPAKPKITDEKKNTVGDKTVTEAKQAEEMDMVDDEKDGEIQVVEEKSMEVTPVDNNDGSSQ
jgi:hypothetical protein